MNKIRAVAVKFLEFALRKLAPRYWIASGVVVVPLAVSITFILSTGPHIQRYFFALINSDAPTIYESAHRGDVVQYLSLGHWLSTAVYFVLMGLAVAVAAVRNSKARHVFAYTMFAAFVVLMVVDLGLGIYERRLTLAFLFENIVANSFGSAILAFLVIAILIGRVLSLEYAPGPLQLRQAIAAIFTAGTGVLFSVFLYYAALLFYQPLPQRLSAYLGQPLSGFMAAEAIPKERSTDGEDALPAFLLVPGIAGTSGRWLSAEGPLEVIWGTRGAKRTVDVSVELYEGCPRSPTTNTQKSARPWVFKNTKELRVSFDPGISEFFTLKSEKQREFTLKLETENPLFYRVDRDATSNNLTVTQSTYKETTLTFSDVPDQLAFYIAAPLFAPTGKDDIQVSKRTLRIAADDRSHTITFEPAQQVSRTTPTQCRTISASVAAGAEHGAIGVNTYAGAIVRIQQVAPFEWHNDDAGALRVKGEGGSITVSEISDQNWGRGHDGGVGLMSFSGNIISLELDGVQSTARLFDNFAVYGDLQGRVEQSGKMRLTGTAKAIWRDRHRLSPTRWERLPWEARLMLLSLLGTALTVIVRSVVVRLRDDGQVCA